MPLSEDLTQWEFWWEFGKDPYLRLRDAVLDRRSLDDALVATGARLRVRDVVPPNDADRQRVAETLAEMLRKATDRDTVSSCLVALAKIGRDVPGRDLRSAFVPFLQRNDQELRETAAVAIGIAGRADDDSVATLTDLLTDAEKGREASGGQAVNERTRAFAAFGLGLLLHRAPGAAIERRIVETLSAIVRSPATHSRDVKVAAIEALSMLGGTPASAARRVLRATATDDLLAYYDRDLGPGEQLMQAHVPPAIARLLEGDAANAAASRARFTSDLASGTGARAGAERTRIGPHIAQSCALALGGLCSPWDDDLSPDAAVGEALRRAYREHHDQQTRSFALLSIARIGGKRARTVLLEELAAANRAIETPWCGIALGVLTARAQRSTTAVSTSSDDPEVTAALQKAFATAKAPAALGALAMALGLAGGREASGDVRAALREHTHRDELAGYLALALGLMDDRLAIGEVRQLVAEAGRRPQVMLQGVRTLGLLGDIGVVDELCHHLENPDPSLVRLSALSSALGQIGDRRSIDPLLAMAQNERLTPLTRAFAVVALGMVCDKDPLPWNAAYATNCNYQASTDTLTDGAAGILDIL